MAPAEAATLAAARAPTAARTPMTAPPEDGAPKSGTESVRAVIDNVVTLPTPLTGRDQGGGGDGPADDEYALPPGFPVTPLGVSVEVDGLYCHYIDAAGRLRSLRDKDHTRLHLFGLVGKDIHLLKFGFGFEKTPRQHPVHQHSRRAHRAQLPVPVADPGSAKPRFGAPLRAPGAAAEPSDLLALTLAGGRAVSPQRPAPDRRNDPATCHWTYRQKRASAGSAVDFGLTEA